MLESYEQLFDVISFGKNGYLAIVLLMDKTPELGQLTPHSADSTQHALKLFTHQFHEEVCSWKIPDNVRIKSSRRNPH